MPFIIDKAQSTFIHGMSISDNILLAQELFRGYDRETGVPKCSFMINLHKAFDSIDWSLSLGRMLLVFQLDFTPGLRLSSALLLFSSNLMVLCMGILKVLRA